MITNCGLRKTLLCIIILFMSQACGGQELDHLYSNWTAWERLPEIDTAIWQPSAFQYTPSGALYVFHSNNESIVHYTYRIKKDWARWVPTKLKSTHGPIALRDEKTSDFILGVDDLIHGQLSFYRLSYKPGYENSVPRLDHRVNVSAYQKFSPTAVLANNGSLHAFARINDTLFTNVRVNKTYGGWTSLNFTTGSPFYASVRAGGLIDVSFGREKFLNHLIFNNTWSKPFALGTPGDPYAEDEDRASVISLRTRSDLFSIRDYLTRSFAIKKFHADEWPTDWINITGPSKLPVQPLYRYRSFQDDKGYGHIVTKTYPNSLVVTSSLYPLHFTAKDLAYTGDRCNTSISTCGPNRVCTAPDNSGASSCTSDSDLCLCQPDRKFDHCSASSTCLFGDVCAIHDQESSTSCRSCHLMMNSTTHTPVDDFENCRGILDHLYLESTMTPESTEPGGNQSSESPGYQSSETQMTDENHCIAIDMISHLGGTNLVYSTHRRSSALCDQHENCATPGHMLIYRSEPMMMKSYCSKYATCRRKVKWVNSPRMSLGVRFKSRSVNIVFTAFSATNQHWTEEWILSSIVYFGL